MNIGKNVSINHGCMVHCRASITIGDDVQFLPNVLLYDHDHDYKAEGGVKSMQYIDGPITIGNNVWIGANTVILKGSEIGDNVVNSSRKYSEGKSTGKYIVL